jgi:hydrogenase maturation protease
LKELENPGLSEELIRNLILSEKTLVVGLGNPDRADDGAGIEIVSHWKARLKKRAFVEPETSVETVVMNHLDDDGVEAFLFVDAADFGGTPGEIHRFGIEDASSFKPAWSTHQVPIGLLMQLIASKKKRAFLLGIQAGSVELFGAMTRDVIQAVEALSLLPD